MTYPKNHKMWSPKVCKFEKSLKNIFPTDSQHFKTHSTHYSKFKNSRIIQNWAFFPMNINFLHSILFYILKTKSRNLEKYLKKRKNKTISVSDDAIHRLH